MSQIPCELCNGILDDECTECFGRGVVESRTPYQSERTPREYYGHDLPGEEWKPIKGRERYHVSNFGRIVNTETGNLIKPSKNNAGQRVFRSRHKGMDVGASWHRIVAEHFLPDWNPKFKVELIDGNPDNCRVDNLRMGVIPVRGKAKDRVVEK